jgi:hypothetical protein
MHGMPLRDFVGRAIYRLLRWPISQRHDTSVRDDLPLERRSTMPRSHVATRPVTLHRLPGVQADDMINAIDVELADGMDGDLHSIRIAGMPAIWVDGCLAPEEPAEWCADASVTTGLPIDHRDQRSGGLLLICVDATAYAIGYGQQGHRLLLDEKKDQRFGLRFAIRVLDPHQVNELTRRFPSARGRTDITYVPGRHRGSADDMAAPVGRELVAAERD